jgi:phospho-N-acetylmuramoyl-pentapeptide-transferase
MTPLLKSLVLAAGMALATILVGIPGLPMLRRLKVGQVVRDDGPKTHLTKSGTPTFGGLLFLVPILVFGIVGPLLFPQFDQLPALTFMMVGFAFVGFLDDYIKVRIDRKGLSVLAKSALLISIATAFSVYLLYFSDMNLVIVLPFAHGAEPVAVVGWGRAAYAVFLVVFLYVVTNAVNITDGVDGLASSVTVVVSFTLGLLSLALPEAVDDRRAITYFAFSMVGGCLGFLYYNRHPARVFMGDTGSMALGAGVAGISILMGCPWILIPAGIVYVLDAGSVALQVFWYKRTKTRIFRMSPIHHHYELGGWSERRIVLVFCAVAVVGCAVAALSILL